MGFSLCSCCSITYSLQGPRLGHTPYRRSHHINISIGSGPMVDLTESRPRLSNSLILLIIGILIIFSRINLRCRVFFLDFE